MSNNGGPRPLHVSHTGGGNNGESNNTGGTFTSGENGGSEQTPNQQDFRSTAIENHIVSDVERIIEQYRNSEQSKGTSLVAVVRLLESSINPPDTRKEAIIKYTALLDDIEHQRELQARRGQSDREGNQNPVEQDGGSPHPRTPQRPRSRNGGKSTSDAIDDLINSLQPGSDGSHSDSDVDREDGEPGSKRRRPFSERQLPWYATEKRVRASGDPNITKTRRTLDLFAQDPTRVKRLIGSCQSAPHGFPLSEWDNIIKGNTINLDVVLSSLHHVGAPRENRGRIGDNEISLGRSEPSRKVETSGQWTSAWNAGYKAIRFAFPHREDELRGYGDYIEDLFASRLTSSHSRIILFDKAVRAQVGGGQCLLLTDANKFGRLASAILMPDGVESDRSHSKGKNAPNVGSKSNSTCNRFNTSQGCPNSKAECRYKHICKKCNANGHGACACTSASSST